MMILELPDEGAGVAFLKVDGRLDGVLFFDKCVVRVFEGESVVCWNVALTLRDELFMTLWPDAIRRK